MIRGHRARWLRVWRMEGEQNRNAGPLQKGVESEANSGIVPSTTHHAHGAELAVRVSE